MKVVAIDAGAPHSPLSRSVELAATAARRAGADVELVRLRRLRIRCCTDCGICQLGGHCKIEDDLPALASLISQADGVIYGVPEQLFRIDEKTRSVVERLNGYFLEDAHCQTTSSETSTQVKHAILITASRSPFSLATFFGYRTGPMRTLRDALDARGFRTIGSLVMSGGGVRRNLAQDHAERACSLGRVLAGRV